MGQMVSLLVHRTHEVMPLSSPLWLTWCGLYLLGVWRFTCTSMARRQASACAKGALCSASGSARSRAGPFSGLSAFSLCWLLILVLCAVIFSQMNNFNINKLQGN